VPAGEKSSKPSRSSSPDKNDRSKEQWNDNDDLYMNDGERRGREIDRRKGIIIYIIAIIHIDIIILFIIIIVIQRCRG
jgi:hypothetical protein